MPSFDIVSELEMFEIAHAVNNTSKEIATRFDFRGSEASVELKEKAHEIQLSATSDFQVDQLRSMLEAHMIKRRIDPQVMEVKDMQASGRRMLQTIVLKDGLDQDSAKKIVKLIKEEGLKVQASIQGDKVRVSDKKKDSLQAVMALLREQSLGLPLQFNNFKD